jgi:hypothetical protein
MMDDFNWNYVWAAIVINFVLVYVVPKLIKKPTGFKPLDDVVLYLNSQKGFLFASSIVVGLVVYGAHYWVESQGGASAKGPASPPSRAKDF